MAANNQAQKRVAILIETELRMQSFKFLTRLKMAGIEVGTRFPHE